jgi:hypothetical protein
MGIMTKTRDLADLGGGFIQTGTGAIQRTVESKLKDVVSVKDFGAVGDGVADDTAAINIAVASGKSLQWPQGTYRVTSSIVCTTNQTWMAAGEVTINYDAAAASAAAPVLDFREEIHIDGDFIINHNANTKGFITPAVYNGNIIAGSAVLIQGDYSTVSNIQVRNAWDNGIAVVKLNPSTGAETAGSPKFVALSNIRTISCGVGEHTAPALTPGKIGGGIDIGSGSACTVSNCIDNGSYLGFILDLGAGGQAMFSNCTAFYTKRDASNPTNGSGYGFYVGSGDSAFVNCYSIGSDYRGWWYDGTAQNCDFVNCAAYIPKYEGLYIKGGAAQFENFRIKGASFVGSGTADAVLIDSSAGNINELQLEVQTTGSNHRYGVNLSGVNQIDAFITGNLSGITGKTNNLLSYEIGLHLFDAVNGVKQAFNRADAGFSFDFYGKHRVSASAANASYISTTFGDSGNNGTVFVEDFATPAKRAAFGYDPTNDGFVIQSIQSGVSKKPLFLNPSGGQVMLGKGEWTDPARLGNYYLWVDGGGKLRIKSGAPANDGDGTVVGTQT